MVNLDRFAYGRPDPQAQPEKPQTCGICGREIQGEYCERCIEEKITKAMIEIDSILDEYGLKMRTRGPNVALIDIETGHENYF